MKSVDTNVLVRWLLRDDPLQAELADATLDHPIEIALTVMLELGWVLTTVGGMTRQQCADAFAAILTIDGAVFADRDGLAWAVDRYRAGADWPDMIHLLSTRHARSFATFERRLARSAGTSTPIPVEVIGA